MIDAELAQLALDRADLAVELVDQRDRGENVGSPGVREIEPLEQRAAAPAEQIRDRAGVPEAETVRPSVCEAGAG